MKKNLLAIITLTVTPLLLAGCGGINTVENAQKEGLRQMVTDQRVINDVSLARKVAIVGVKSAMTPGGLLKVQVEVENQTASRRRFGYRFEWFDANGMQVANVLSATIPEQLEGKESKFIYSIAPNADCRDFRVKFAESN